MIKSILTVTAPADTIDLTVLATVKTALDITGDDNDAKLQGWITQASAIAASYCKRVFGQETLSELYRPQRQRAITSDTLILSRRPVTSITSVTIDDTVLDTSEYEVNYESGLLSRLDSTGYPVRWYAAKSIVVVYVAGYELLATLPNDIEAAVIAMVRDFNSDSLRDPNLIEKETFGVSRYRWWAPDQIKTTLPIEISGLLDPYVDVWG